MGSPALSGFKDERVNKLLDQQNYDAYATEDHETWAFLFKRQMKILESRACQEFLTGLDELNLTQDKLPDYNEINKNLRKRTGWEAVIVKGFIPPEIFFEFLANKKFPATAWIRKPEELDYLEEPDIFHDVFGHLPLLSNPMFANYMEEFGKGGLRAIEFGMLEQIQRLYWFTVEFGLINTANGIKIYGSGILSSKGESEYSVDSTVPHRLGFDLKRVMRTTYRIDEFQKTYFVIDSFEHLFKETMQDFAPIYEELKSMPLVHWTDLEETDTILHKGTPPVDDKPPMSGTDKYING